MYLIYQDLCFLAAAHDYMRRHSRAPAKFDLFRAGNENRQLVNDWIEDNGIPRWRQPRITGNDKRDESMARLRQANLIHRGARISPYGRRLIRLLGHWTEWPDMIEVDGRGNIVNKQETCNE